MNHISVIGLFLLPAMLVAADSPDPVDQVDTRFGTEGKGSEYAGTIPGVGTPFAMTNWTAMTRVNGISVAAYNYNDTAIMGFLGSHQPAIWMGDYGHMAVMPGTGTVETAHATRGIPFAHGEELARPDFYSVVLHPTSGGTITVEMTASEHAALMRFTWAGTTGDPHVVIDGSLPGLNQRANSKDDVGRVEIDIAKHEVKGWNRDRHSAKLGPKLPNFRGWYVAEFSTPITALGVASDGAALAPGTSAEAHIAQGAVGFPAGTRQVMVRIGTSFIDEAQARDNLRREIPGWNLDQIRAATHAAWKQQLSRITVEGGSAEDHGKFAAAMYRAHMFPRIFSEYGRYYSAFDDQIHQGESYNDYSMWDTFRALHPLLIFTSPERVGPMITALLQMQAEGGWLPKWPNPSYTGIMIGSPAEAIIADAWVKGIRTFDLQRAWQACWKNADTPQVNDEKVEWRDRIPWTGYPEVRQGLTNYKAQGWVANNLTNESVSTTLEMAHQDFCTAQLAQASGHPAEAKILLQRSQNYRNLWYDGFFTARNADGTWAPKKGYTEGNEWVWRFSVMHDIPGLIELMGGPAAFTANLEGLFKKYYQHSNEPGHHCPYLFAWSTTPWRTQELVRKIIKERYHNDPRGNDGNEDCGQMSAWLIFSSLGFYPVCPGSDTYVLGIPSWKRAVLNLGDAKNPKHLTILANNLSEANCYVQSVKLNGVKLDKPFIHHGDLMAGGTLEFDLGPQPVK